MSKPKALKLIVVVLTITALALGSVAIALADADFAGSVDPTATVSRTGVVTLTGKVTCNSPMSLYVYGQLRQSFGRKTLITGSFSSLYMSCSGEPMPWSTLVTASNGIFVQGRADFVLTVSGCGGYYGCQTLQTLQTIQLERIK